MTLGTYTCNCACQRCLAGSCCMYPDPGPNPMAFQTWTTTSTPTLTTMCQPTDHDFDALSKKRLFCRKCGTTRDV